MSKIRIADLLMITWLAALTVAYVGMGREAEPESTLELGNGSAGAAWYYDGSIGSTLTIDTPGDLMEMTDHGTITWADGLVISSTDAGKVVLWDEESNAFTLQELNLTDGSEGNP